MIREITDPAAVAAIYNADMAKRVGHDHCPAGYIDHPAVRYFGAYVGDDLVGLFVRIETTWIEVDVHAVIHRRAIQHARSLGREFIALMFQDPAVQKLTAPVFEDIPSAVNYCKRLGFRYEGFRRACFVRSGHIIGLHILGLTREDYERHR
jgi:hypothetical protein